MSWKKPLTQDFLRSVLHYDEGTGVFTWKIDSAYNVKAGRVAGHLHPDGYVKITIKKVTYMAHRLAWLAANGEWIRQPDYEIDHINRNKSDNRISNLRLVTRSENMQNRSVTRSNKCGLKGVFAYRHDKTRWTATIRYDGKQRCLGVFDTKEEAHAAYVAAALDNHRCYCV